MFPRVPDQPRWPPGYLVSTSTRWEGRKHPRGRPLGFWISGVRLVVHWVPVETFTTPHLVSTSTLRLTSKHASVGGRGNFVDRVHVETKCDVGTCTRLTSKKGRRRNKVRRGNEYANLPPIGYPWKRTEEMFRRVPNVSTCTYHKS
eukprot:gene12137-biopygen8566